MRSLDSEKKAVEVVIEALERTFGVTKEELRSPSKPDRITWPRQIGMACLVRDYGFTLKAASRAFGRINHTSAIYATRMVGSRIETDEEARGKFNEFRALMTGSVPVDKAA